MDERVNGLARLPGARADRGDGAPPPGSLRGQEQINRWLGGTDLTRRAIREIADSLPPRWDLTLLDVGTGGADIPLDLLRTWGARWPRLQITAVDVRPEVIAGARLRRPALGTTPGLTLAVADGRTLPFPDRSFDIVHASLLVHRFDAAEAVGLLAELARVTRVAVVVNDVSRPAAHPLAVTAADRCCLLDSTGGPRWLPRWRGRTAAELDAMLEEAGLERIAIRFGLMGHRYALVARPTGR